MDDIRVDDDRIEVIEPPRRRRRAWGVLVLLLLVLPVALVAGLIAALRLDVLAPDDLPPGWRPIAAAVRQFSVDDHFGLGETVPVAEPPRVTVAPDRLANIDPEMRTSLFGQSGEPEYAFVRLPGMGPDTMCEVMNLAGLSDATWAPDPVIPGEWNCFTSVRAIGGDIEEDPSTVFGFIRGRNRGTADVVRITVVLGGEQSAAEARDVGRRVLDALLKQAGIAAPAGFVDAAAGGEAFDQMDDDYRFMVQVSPATGRTDAIVMTTMQPGLLPSDWFSGRVPRLPGDPIVGPEASVDDPDLDLGDQPIPGFGAPLESGQSLPPGFEVDVAPDPASPDATDPDAPAAGEGAEPLAGPVPEADGSPPAPDDAPIDNVAQ